MLTRVMTCAFLAISLTRPLVAMPEAWGSPHDSLQSEMVKVLSLASDHIDVAVFEFSSRPLAQALERATQRGVLVRLLIDCGHATSLPLGLDAADIRCLDGRVSDIGVMHNKFALLDHAQIVTGSFNWTASAERLNFENLIRVDDPSVVGRFNSLFESLWCRGKTGVGRHPAPRREQWTAKQKGKRRKRGRVSRR